MVQANEFLLGRIAGIRNVLMAHYSGGIAVPNAVKGSERETLVREFLQKVFPSHFRFSTGAITDMNGNVSGEIDIAVEYPFLPSFPLPATNNRLLLAESVAAVIEVKSDLSSQWKEVERTVREVRKIDRKWSGHVSHVGGNVAALGPRTSKIPCLAVGFIGHKTHEGLNQRLESTDEECRPVGALVIDSGLFLSRDGTKAIGPYGIFAFCAMLSHFIKEVAYAESHLLSYLGPPTQQ